MVYKLTILERITLNNILPPAGNFVTLGLVRKLREALSFSEEEHAEFGIVVDEASGQIHWKSEHAATESDIEIGEKMTDLVVSTLEKMNKEERLTDQHFSLYEKFVKEAKD